MTLVIYWTDALIYLLLFTVFFFLWHLRKSVLLRRMLQKILMQARYIVSGVVLLSFVLIGLIDSIHFTSSPESVNVISVLDKLLSPRSFQTEETYSAPFATQSYVPEFVKTADLKLEEVYSPLEFVGKGIKAGGSEPISAAAKKKDILQRITKGLLLGISLSLILFLFIEFFVRKIFSKTKAKDKGEGKSNNKGEGTSNNKINKPILWSFWLTTAFIICIVTVSAYLMFEYHILGTDKVGRDVFYMSLKSIRTGLIIGSLTTFIMLPFALLFGMLAGYFPGLIDDIIQYVYITLSSIPAVLLIAAAVVSLQIKIEANPDLKLLLLCMILGLTSWTSLCRYVRGETIKLRETEFVQAAITLGTRKSSILWRHVLPNLMHIVVITIVLDFSGLVLAEALLTYIGVGVDPSTYSWGTMINAARLEMARDPIVWWSLMGALILMFTLVFSANIFSEAVQEALSPRRE